MIRFTEKASLKEMAIISSKTDADLEDIDIAVFSNEHFPKHATILKRNNHKIFLGRFLITPNPPKSYSDVKEVKESIDPKYKRQIFVWAKKPNTFVKGETNWKALDTAWDLLNHN